MLALTDISDVDVFELLADSVAHGNMSHVCYESFEEPQCASTLSEEDFMADSYFASEYESYEAYLEEHAETCGPSYGCMWESDGPGCTLIQHSDGYEYIIWDYATPVSLRLIAFYSESIDRARAFLAKYGD